MKALVAAQYLGPDGHWFRFQLDHGVEARITFPERDIGRHDTLFVPFPAAASSGATYWHSA